MSNIKPDYVLRKNLDKLSKDELIDLFRNIDFKTSKDWKCDTKQRIIRGIEIASSKDKIKVNKVQSKLDLSESIVLGIKMDRDIVVASDNCSSMGHK